MMNRRAFLRGLTLGMMAAPLAGEAQQPANVPRVGYLSMLSRSVPTFAPLRDAFLQGLREHGYTEGRTVIFEHRFAEGKPERLPELAAELVRLKVKLIFTESTPAARAAMSATTTSPLSLTPLPIRWGKGSSPPWRGRAATSLG
jgi:putative ABC transport system substrate-binding protein